MTPSICAVKRTDLCCFILTFHLYEFRPGLLSNENLSGSGRTMMMMIFTSVVSNKNRLVSWVVFDDDFFIIYITIDDFLGVCPSFRKLLLGFLRYQAEIFCVDSY